MCVTSGRFSGLDPQDMQMYVHLHKVLVKDIKRNKFIVSRTNCSLVRHRVFGRFECLANEGRIPLGALTACLSHKVKR